MENLESPARNIAGPTFLEKDKAPPLQCVYRTVPDHQIWWTATYLDLHAHLIGDWIIFSYIYLLYTRWTSGSRWSPDAVLLLPTPAGPFKIQLASPRIVLGLEASNKAYTMGLMGRLGWFNSAYIGGHSMSLTGDSSWTLHVDF